LPVRGSDQGRGGLMRRRMPTGFSVALGAVAASAFGAGCSVYERAEIKVSRRAIAARAPDGALLIPISDGPVDDGGVDFRMTLASSGGTSQAELGLVASALDFVGAHAQIRSVVDGLGHFSRESRGPRVIIRIEHAGGRGDETWILDRTWALRKMACGAMLVWEGELAPVLERLSIVLRGRGGILK
jgi:hypothetical protein